MQLIKGDCLEVMDELIAKGVKVDMVLTDPPYGMSFQSNYRIKKHKKIKNDNSLEWLDDFVNKSYELLKEDTASYVFCSFHHIDKFKQAFEKKFKIKNILVWEKNNTSMGDLKADFAPKIEFVLFLQKGRCMIRGKRDSNIFKFDRTCNKLHPTEKPVDMMEYLISKFSDEGQLILDPFMGSGTTGVACKNLERDFIGVELDSHFYRVARRRLRS